MDSVKSTFHPGTADSRAAELSEFLTQFLENGANPIPATDLAAHAGIIFEKVFPDTDAESAFNLLLLVLGEIEGSEKSTQAGAKQQVERNVRYICDAALSSLSASANNNTGDQQNRYGLRLRLLMNLFNKLQPQCSARLDVLLAAVALCAKNNDLSAVRPQLAHLPAWFESWKIPEARRRETLKSLEQTMRSSGDLKTAQKLLLMLLSSYTDTEMPEDADELALRAVGAALRADHVLAFAELAALPAVQHLSRPQSPYASAFALLKIFVDGTLRDLRKFLETDRKTLSLFELSEENCVRKIKMLTLASLAAENVSGEVPYSTIATELDLQNAEDVEEWIIDVIQAGLIDAKMDQIRQTVNITRAAHRSFADTQWSTIAARLDAWKSSLDEILKVVENVKSVAKTQPRPYHANKYHHSNNNNHQQMDRNGNERAMNANNEDGNENIADK